MTAERTPGPVEAATARELEAMGKGAAEAALGASALDLARRQDAANQPNFAAQCAKELRETLKVLAERFPPPAEEDWLDEIRKREEGEA